MILELHLTYRCDLACTYCNRGCRIRTDHTPDMTLEQARCVLTTAPEPIAKIVLIGGEPTLHPDCVEFGKLARELCPDATIQIYSNGYTEHARRVIGQLKELNILNCGGTEKLSGSVTHNLNPFISPADLGIERKDWCSWAAFNSCGYSVDANGITLCAIGGSICGILGLPWRTWDWREAMDRERLLQMCKHCGTYYEFPPIPPERLHDFRGQQMTKSWYDAATRPVRQDCVVRVDGLFGKLLSDI